MKSFKLLSILSLAMFTSIGVMAQETVSPIDPNLSGPPGFATVSFDCPLCESKLERRRRYDDPLMLPVGPGAVETTNSKNAVDGTPQKR